MLQRPRADVGQRGADQGALPEAAAGETRASGTDFSVTVPKGTIWVMGDNRYDSKDSRYNGDTPSKGFVPLSDVTGRAFVISWPSSRWTWLDDHPEVFAGVEEREQ